MVTQRPTEVTGQGPGSASLPQFLLKSMPTLLSLSGRPLPCRGAVLWGRLPPGGASYSPARAPFPGLASRILLLGCSPVALPISMLASRHPTSSSGPADFPDTPRTPQDLAHACRTSMAILHVDTRGLQRPLPGLPTRLPRPHMGGRAQGALLTTRMSSSWSSDHPILPGKLPSSLKMPLKCHFL